MICAHWARVVYKYNAKGDRLFLSYELANFENDQSAPNLLAIIDTENGNVIRKFGLKEPVEFIEDDLGIIYLRNSASQFLLWNLDAEDYAGTSKTAKLKLDNNLFLTISLEGESYITDPESSAICQIGKIYSYEDHPAIFQFQQANGRLAYLDFIQNEIFYWNILNCQLINTLKLTDITSQ
jgi:hypothetical protein